ncbi:MAG: phosphate propanoyltransferase [Actinobacteria bacterium]|nr:phosphate propanoyltransferase [Actinomycetota bacterium]
MNTESTNSTVKQDTDLRHDRKIVCGVSVRHIHLCKEHLEVLFGKGYALNVLRELYNPGYASKETLTVVGPKLTAIQNVRILGPLRSKTQVELAKTDCIVLGIDAPVRPSGEVEGTSSCVLVGPKGAVYLSEGAIRANRHLHMSTEDAGYFKIRDNQVVDIRVPGPKGLTFNNVQVRVAPDFKTEFHVDTDDGNAADIVNGSIVEIVDASCISPLTPQMANGDRIPPSIPDGSFVGEVTDPNLLKNICAIATGQTCTREQIANAMAAVKSAQTSANSAKSQEKVQDSSAGIGSGEASAGGGISRKTLITAGDLEKYIQTGICVTKDVILSPLARDEAIARGIAISYER